MSDLQVGDIITKLGWADKDREVIVGEYCGYWVCVDVVDIEAALEEARGSVWGDGRGEFPDTESGHSSIRLRAKDSRSLIKWTQEWEVGDKVYHPTAGDNLTVVGSSGDFYWLEASDGYHPATYHKNSPYVLALVKAAF